MKYANYMFFWKHRPETFETFSSSEFSFPLSKASGLLQYLGINVPLWLNQLFEMKFSALLSQLKQDMLRWKGICVFLRLERCVESNEHPLKVKLSILSRLNYSARYNLWWDSGRTNDLIGRRDILFVWRKAVKSEWSGHCLLLWENAYKLNMVSSQ